MNKQTAKSIERFNHDRLANNCKPISDRTFKLMEIIVFGTRQQEKQDKKMGEIDKA
jgi:hypothetical protein